MTPQTAVTGNAAREGGDVYTRDGDLIGVSDGANVKDDIPDNVVIQ